MRANFDGVKSDYCKVPEPISTDGNGVHLHGHTVTDVKDEGSQVRVFYKRQEGTQGSMLADMVVAADGPSSTIRKIFDPNVKRTYTGYCGLRGTVPENEASEAAREVSDIKLVIHFVVLTQTRHSPKDSHSSTRVVSRYSPT